MSSHPFLLLLVFLCQLWDLNSELLEEGVSAAAWKNVGRYGLQMMCWGTVGACWECKVGSRSLGVCHCSKV